MDAVLIRARKKSDVQSLLDFSEQIGVKAKVVTIEDMEDEMLAHIIESRLDSPSVSREEIMKILDE
ncbi:MAG: hypothetical protein LBE36_06310 [Flavobacteriaceae bacterium]|nr:hypothetical protein [Flavobacteriaceae bacterium]